MTETAVTLYSLEHDLVAYLDTEDAVPAEQQQEFSVALQEQLKAAVDKREAVAHVRAHLLAQEQFAKDEAKRLKERADRFAAAVDRLDKYIESTILSLPRDHKSKPAKLEGRTVTLQLRACPESVLITDEFAIPSTYKRVSLTMPAPIWEAIVRAALKSAPDGITEALEKHVVRGDLVVDKVALKRDLKAGVEVYGADLATDKWKVEIK
jgi:hypothetical protein